MEKKERLKRVNECLLGFGPDPLENINRLTALCGDLLGATCALYNRLEQGMLCSWGQWHAPSGYRTRSRPDGHICYDVIKRSGDEILVVRDLAATEYARTDPNVELYKLKTYIGHVVELDGAHIGSLCAVFQHDYIPSDEDKELFILISGAIGIEERRRQAQEALKDAHKGLEVQVAARTAELVEANKKLNLEIQGRIEVERLTLIHNAVLKLLVQTFSRKDYLDGVVKIIQGLTGCGCVGIKVLNGKEEKPYESYAGFSREFWKRENLEEKRFRGACAEFGFASGSVIPVRYKNKIIASVYLADEKEGKVELKTLEFLETLTPFIGEGIYKFDIADKMRQANELLERVFAVTYFSIAYLDADFNFIRVNQAFAQADGQTPEFFIGKNHFKLYPHEENEAIFRTVVKTRQAYSAYAKPFTYKEHPERGTTYWDWSVQPVKNASGKVEGLVFCLVDVTHRERALEELMKTQMELSDARRLADIGTLSAIVAHELRNPLGVIRTAAYNIKRKSTNPSLDGHIANIEKKIVEADRIINNLLFYSRIKMPQYERVRIYDILEECLAGEKNKYKEKKAVLSKKYRNISKNFIEVDPVQIKEVFNNIVDNAYEALPEKKGKIEVAANLSASKDALRISIKDNGVGIDPLDLQRLSEPFFTTKSNGTGLGLTVSYQIIDLLSGHIDVESRKGSGTTFIITLPVKKKKSVKKEVEHQNI